MEPHLTARDLALFESLRRFRFLTTEQVERLHFPSRQTMLRRVRLLSRTGHLSIFPAYSLSTRVVALGKLGAEAIAGIGGRPWALRREVRSELFLAHQASINEFRIRLEQACRDSEDLELLGFITEQETINGNAGVMKPLIRDEVTGSGGFFARVPDGVFAVRRGCRAALFFLEVDRSTEVVLHPERGLARVVRFYAEYLRTDRYQRYAAVFGAEGFRGFRALMVFRSERRLLSVRERCGRLTDILAEAKHFIWMTTEAAICAADVTRTSWLSLDPEDQTAYAIAGSGAEQQESA